MYDALSRSPRALSPSGDCVGSMGRVASWVGRARRGLGENRGSVSELDGGMNGPFLQLRTVRTPRAHFSAVGRNVKRAPGHVTLPTW